VLEKLISSQINLHCSSAEISKQQRSIQFKALFRVDINHTYNNCQKLESERTKILMEISATWRNIQSYKLSFTELDSISQLQILLDSSKYNKVKIDPTNATRIELLAIRLLFRLHVPLPLWMRLYSLLKSFLKSYNALFPTIISCVTQY
jgi:hypothetical protein